MWKTLWPAAVAVALLWAGAGCGDATGSDALTSDEAAGLTAQMAGAGVAGAGSGIAGSPARASGLEAVPVPINVTVNHTQSCQGGGSINMTGSVSGSIDSETQDGTLSVNITQSITDCRLTEAGKEFTVSGNPNLQVTGNVTIVGGQPSGTQTLTFTGAFQWSANDGRSGSCEIDITINWSPTTASASVTGTACGHNVSRQV